MLLTALPGALRRATPLRKKPMIVPFRMVAPRWPSSAMPSLPAAFTPLIEWPARSSVMLSAPITRPSPGHLSRSFARRVLDVSVCPHVTTVDPKDADAATGTADAAMVRTDANKPVTTYRRTLFTPSHL